MPTDHVTHLVPQDVPQLVVVLARRNQTLMNKDTVREQWGEESCEDARRDRKCQEEVMSNRSTVSKQEEEQMTSIESGEMNVCMRATLPLISEASTMNADQR